jgi:hypothetical protein
MVFHLGERVIALLILSVALLIHFNMIIRFLASPHCFSKRRESTIFIDQSKLTSPKSPLITIETPHSKRSRN